MYLDYRYLKWHFFRFIIILPQDYKQIKRLLQNLNLPWKTPLLTKSKEEKAIVVARVGKIVISVIATPGYNDEILSSPDRRYKRFLPLLSVTSVNVA